MPTGAAVTFWGDGMAICRRLRLAAEASTRVILAGPRRRLAIGAIVIFFCAVVVALQWAGGAYETDIGGRGDDSAHYVTGLMVRDYVATRAPVPPMQFAKDYYLHYPKVGLGHWPPLFYLLEAGWMLLFSPSKISVMLLMALLTTFLAATVCLVVNEEFGWISATAGGLLLVCLPLVQRSASSVMLEIPVTLLAFWAVLFFARFLDSRRWTDSAWFGVLASLAILTHGAALFLAFVPPIGAILQRRIRLLAHPHFWLPAAIVLVLCGPWYCLAPGARHEYVVSLAGLGFWPYLVWRTPLDLLRMMGAALFVLILIGLLVQVLLPVLKRRAPGARWASAAATILAFCLFRAMVSPATDPRHLVMIVPSTIMLLVAGLVWLASRIPMPGLGIGKRQVILALIAGLASGIEVFAVPKPTSHGLCTVAQDLVTKPRFQDSVFLISSDENHGEGQFIAEVAMHERRPGHFVLRASKVLARDGFLGEGYRLLYPTPAEMMQYLESVPVGVLIMDNCLAWGKLEHQNLLRQLLQHYPREWKLVGSYPCERNNPEDKNRVVVYRLLGHETGTAPKLRLDMRDRLNEVLVNRRP